MSDYDFSDFLNIIPDFERVRDELKKNEVRLVQKAANEYSNDVRSHPEFWYKTGTLRRSIHVDTVFEGMDPVAYVGTNVPYARRLEYGFMDMRDSLDRLYHQPARPVWRPVWDNNLHKYEVILAGGFNRKAWERP